VRLARFFFGLHFGLRLNDQHQTLGQFYNAPNSKGKQHMDSLQCSHGPKDRVRLVRQCHHQRSTIAELCDQDGILTLACSTCGRIFARFKIEAGDYFAYNDEVNAIVPVEDRRAAA